MNCFNFPVLCSSLLWLVTEPLVCLLVCRETKLCQTPDTPTDLQADQQIVLISGDQMNLQADLNLGWQIHLAYLQFTPTSVIQEPLSTASHTHIMRMVP